MTNFTATNPPIANCSPGDSFVIQGTIAAATSADAGTNYNVFLVLWNSSNVDIEEFAFFGVTITTTPVTYSCTVVLPANFPLGQYYMTSSVRDSGFIWQTVTQTQSNFSVVVKNFTATNLPIANCAPGATFVIQGTIAAATSGAKAATATSIV